MNKYILITTMAFSALLVSCIGETEKEKQIRAKIKAMDTNINFYGIIIDQNGNPVNKAKVDFTIHRYNPKGSSEYYYTASIKESVLSDNEGLFQIEGKTGFDLFFEIKRTGFEFDYEKNKQRMFKYANMNPQVPGYSPNKNKPYIFYMRKKNQPTLLLNHTTDHLTIKELSAEGYWGFNLIKNDKTKINLKDFKGESIVYDLKMWVKQNKPGELIINFKTVGNLSGVKESENDKYLAPDTGYNQTVSINLKKGIKSKINVFVKSRKHPIYSFANFDFRIKDKGFVLYLETKVNPFGGKDFDEFEYIPWRLKDKLIEEYTNKLEAGILPKSEGLKELVEKAIHEENEKKAKNK